MTTLFNNQNSLSNLQEASGRFKFINRTSRSRDTGKTMYYVNVLQVVWGRLILFGVEPRSVYFGEIYSFGPEGGFTWTYLEPLVA